MSLHCVGEPDIDPGGARPGAQIGIIGTDILCSFPELVRQLGGNPDGLLRRARIDPAISCNPGAVFEYKSWVLLMQHAAEELLCPEFGLRLAAMQDCHKALGPMGVVMQNSRTLGEAIDYCCRHIHAYSLATCVQVQPFRPHRMLFRFDILLEGMLDWRQAVEHALLLASLGMFKSTDGTVRPRQVLFRHKPLSDPKTYRAYFGCDVRFGQKRNGLVLSVNDLLCPVVDPDTRVYEMATSFIESRYPHSAPPIHARVRAIILQHLGAKDCTSERIAGELCMHPRTLQRRLRAEGASFETIKDEVRRDVALRCIQQADMPLTRVAEKLGYAEASVLSRSCYRWFSASPRELRTRMKSGIPVKKRL